MTSSESSPDTGNRECPVSAAATITASAVSVALTNRTRTRGVRTSSAVLPEKEIDRASRPAVGFSSVPWAADRRTSECSSTADRADRSSSCGSTPIIFSTRLAVPLSTTISGLNIIVEIRIGVMTVFAVSSGSAIAMFFGTSSPNTIDSTVAIDSPRITPTESAVGLRQPDGLQRHGDQAAIAGCMTKPSARVVTVMPTCAPDSWVDSDRSPIISDFAPLSPSAACLATVARSTVTRLNSAETYRAVPAIRIEPDTEQDPLRDQCSMLHRGDRGSPSVRPGRSPRR